jgi:hypothetical protein
VSLTSLDAKAVVRAIDALTTQVGRIADAQPTPVVEHVLGATTTADDEATKSVRIPLPGIPECGPGCFCRRNDTEQAPAADEEAQRATRRDSARNLLARLDRGGLLSPADCALLRQHFDAEAREADTARAVAAGNKRHVRMIVPELEAHARKNEQLLTDLHRLRAELEQAQAAVAELAQAIRLTREYVGEELLPPVDGWSWYDALRRHAPHELTALDGTEQPTTEAAPVREQRERPTHPDGTPYSYAEIKAEGWDHCDGCRTWTTATPERPHQCPQTHTRGPVTGPPG